MHKSHHFKLTPSPSVPALQARKAIRLAIDCSSFGNTNASKRPVSAEWKNSVIGRLGNEWGQLAANKGNFSTAASISRRNDGAFLQRVAAAVTSQVQSLSYYIDLLHNGCSGDGTDLQGPRHGLLRNGRASGADLRTTWCTHRYR